MRQEFVAGEAERAIIQEGTIIQSYSDGNHW